MHCIIRREVPLQNWMTKEKLTCFGLLCIASIEQKRDVDEFEDIVSMMKAEGKLPADESEPKIEPQPQPNVPGVEEEVISAAEATSYGDRGVTRDFVKQALKGKHVIFVIGMSLFTVTVYQLKYQMNSMI